MKNIFIGAVMLIGTFAFASSNENIENYNESHYIMKLVDYKSVGWGWCENSVYDPYGNLVAYSYTLEPNEAACKEKGRQLLFEYLLKKASEDGDNSGMN